ncbi:hypothetical protein [Stenotrophomonas sp. SY1]|uniref:hypothetical protein n=1 Tax=Stenotrophomonas sp. SY1 TaxID=477235 RepID=UPI001E491936|nr:hypothetical protein [Stenotrophomonas sp. SY1]MCD9087334.1 hypothetical protein [Stenotrophomonas sp. SY1]
MVNKGLAFLLMSATASGVGTPAGAMSAGSLAQSASARWVAPSLGESSALSKSDSNLAVHISKAIRPSAGTLVRGDLAALGGKCGAGFMSDLLLGAALFLQEAQTPVDRKIQEIVSQNFYSYWD